MNETTDNSEAGVRKRIEQEAKEFAKISRQAPPVGGPPAAHVHPAASVIVMREPEASEAELEVLLARRSQNVRFMPGAWVFPGGRLDDEDGAIQDADDEAVLAAFKVCAAREADEEVGVTLPDPTVLVWFSHWITPQGLPHRFDTRFFIAPAPDDANPVADGYEVEQVRWITPTDAIQANAADEMTIFFPTLKQLERLIGVTSYAAATAIAEAQPIAPIMPKVLMEDGAPRVLLPGDEGYEEVPSLGA